MEESTIVVIITSATVLFGLIAKLVYNSKCKKTVCCFGLCEIQRDTENEVVVNVSSNNLNK